MLLSHYILHAYFLSSFVVTATPIPTSPQLLPPTLPNLSSDHLSMRDTPVSAILPSTLQVREGVETTPPHIAPRTIPNIPEQAHNIGEIEKRMEPAGPSHGPSGSVRTPSSGHVDEYTAFQRLFEQIESQETTSPERCSKTMSTIASDLDNITSDRVKFLVAKYLNDNREHYKKFIVDLDSRLDPSSQRTAVEAIRDWENKVNKWYGGDPNLPQRVAKGQAQLLLKLLKGSTQTDFEDVRKVRNHAGHLTDLISMVLQMTIDDTRELHKELLDAASHVESTLIPACAAADRAEWNRYITKELRILEGYTRIFVTEFIPSTRS